MWLMLFLLQWDVYRGFINKSIKFGDKSLVILSYVKEIALNAHVDFEFRGKSSNNGKVRKRDARKK